MIQNKNSKNSIRLPLFIAIAICIGIFIGLHMNSGMETASPAGTSKSLYKFKQIISRIQNDYVDQVNTDELIESAISDMLEKLDPHTVYIPAEELELTQSQLEGNFEGIGIEFNIFHDTIHVVTPISGGPSEAVGLRPGDKIITVDGETVAGINLSNRKVISLLRGPKGSEVNIQVKRNATKDLMDFTIERDVIPQFSVDVAYMVKPKVGYIKINRFSATTYDEFEKSMKKLEEENMETLILDLTGNPGGYMNPAVKIVDDFLAGRQMIVYTKGKDSRHNTEYFSEIEGSFEQQPIIVLIDEGSASASEIVTGALQDHDRALVVGRRSYGKGLVQMPIELNDGSAMRLTISRYYTPSGRCIQKPYAEGIDKYHEESYERFLTGEIYSEDSIKVNDSLVYTTDNGRKVYGGGGIIPDYFVPLDTTQNSRYLTRLFNSNTIQEFSIKYYNQHKAELDALGKEKFIADFKISEAILNDLIAAGENNKVKFQEQSYEKSKAMIKNFLKAYIGRCAWSSEGFYPVYNQQNEILLRALELLEEAKNISKKPEAI